MIQQTGSRVVYENRWMRVREDAVVRSDGLGGRLRRRREARLRARRPARRGPVYLVEQYRYPVGGTYLEFPQGSWEHDPARGSLEVAHAELREERGRRADAVEPLGHLFLAYGYSTQAMHLFLATA